MLVTGFTSSCYCFLVAATVIVMATMLGQSSAQNYSNTMIIDLRDDETLRSTKRIVVAKVPVLQFLLPGFQGQGIADTDPHYTLDDCAVEGATCRILSTKDVAETFELVYILNDDRFQTEIEMDSRFGAGCRSYMHPQRSISGDGSSSTPVTLTCEPVPANGVQFEGTLTTEWRKFSNMEDLQYFIQNCSMSSESCSEYFRDEVVLESDDFNTTEDSLTIKVPENNQAWFVPSFTFTNSTSNNTYVAPDTFLYRLPRITSHYEFSLEVIEPASDYSEIRCQAESFPPDKEFKWTRDGTDIHTIDRYSFENITSGEQVSKNGTVIIAEVTFEDNALFTCNVAVLGDRVRTDVSLGVRLRVKSHLRPLWPAIGIIAVGILVTLFIIIGHFVDKEIEKYQTEPSNPSTSPQETAVRNINNGRDEQCSVWKEDGCKRSSSSSQAQSHAGKTSFLG